MPDKYGNNQKALLGTKEYKRGYEAIFGKRDRLAGDEIEVKTPGTKKAPSESKEA